MHVRTFALVLFTWVFWTVTTVCSAETVCRFSTDALLFELEGKSLVDEPFDPPILSLTQMIAWPSEPLSPRNRIASRRIGESVPQPNSNVFRHDQPFNLPSSSDDGEVLVRLFPKVWEPIEIDSRP